MVVDFLAFRLGGLAMGSGHHAADMAGTVWYFTFGVDHPLKGKIQPVRGCYEQARQKMFDIYGTNWSSQLGPISAAEQIGIYGYELLPEVK